MNSLLMTDIVPAELMRKLVTVCINGKSDIPKPDLKSLYQEKEKDSDKP